MDAPNIAEPVIDPSAFVAPGSHIHGNVVVGPNAVIMFGAVLRAEFDRISIGTRTNVQDNAVLHCDEGVPCVVGDDVTIGHAAVVHGATVGSHCLIGIGARLLNGSVLGEGAWLAAGSILPEGRSVPAWTIAMGIPAKPIRELTEQEVERQRNGVATYQRLAVSYAVLFAPKIP